MSVRLQFVRSAAMYNYFPVPLKFINFFTDTATTEIYTLSLHDALPICAVEIGLAAGEERKRPPTLQAARLEGRWAFPLDRKSTRLNSSHQINSYAVFCLKKKNTRFAKLNGRTRQHVCICQLKPSVASAK